jgi:hypothetical protein
MDALIERLAEPVEFGRGLVARHGTFGAAQDRCPDRGLSIEPPAEQGVDTAMWALPSAVGDPLGGDPPRNSVLDQLCDRQDAALLLNQLEQHLVIDDVDIGHTVIMAR